MAQARWLRKIENNPVLVHLICPSRSLAGWRFFIDDRYLLYLLSGLLPFSVAGQQQRQHAEETQQRQHAEETQQQQQQQQQASRQERQPLQAERWRPVRWRQQRLRLPQERRQQQQPAAEASK